MTHDEHDKIAKAMLASANTVREAAKAAPLLADKIELQRLAKKLEADRQEHMLAYYQLVREPA